MLPSKNKLKGNLRIEEVKRKGKLRQSDNFGVAYLKREETSDAKFAFIISSKISKLAVQRNRINRSFQEGIRRVLNKIPKDLDFVILAKKNLSSRPTDQIIKEMSDFFDKFKI